MPKWLPRVSVSRKSSNTLPEKDKPIGYSARVTFSVLLTDLDRMEEILVGVVDAGVNEVG